MIARRFELSLPRAWRCALAGAATSALAVALASAASAQPAGTIVPAVPAVLNDGQPIPTTHGDRLHEGLFWTGNRPYLPADPVIATVEHWDYVTEEFFITGTLSDGETYVARILVHRPNDPANFSGLTVYETQHSAGAAQTWKDSRVGFMANGHAHVEINLQQGNLQAYNPSRYREITDHGGASAEADLYGQVGVMLKTAHPSGPEFNTTWLVITGQSQTEGDATTWIESDAANGHGSVRLPDGSPILDGAVVGADSGIPQEDIDAGWYDDLPTILISSQNDWDNLNAADMMERAVDHDPNDDRDGWYRLWQIPGMGHINSREFFAADPRLCDIQPVGHFFGGAYFYLGIEHMYEWLANEDLPPNADRVEFDADGFVTDDVGNAVGGVRSPQLDVPTHLWLGNDGPVSQCGIAMGVVPLSGEQLQQLYSGADDYAGQLLTRAYQLINDGWFPDEYVYQVLEDIAAYSDLVAAAGM